MKPGHLSCLALSLLALSLPPLAAQNPEPEPAPTPPAEAQPAPAPTPRPGLLPLRERKPQLQPAPSPQPPAPEPDLTLADTDCTVLEGRLFQLTVPRKPEKSATEMNAGDFPYSRVLHFCCAGMDITSSWLGKGSGRIVIDLPASATTEKAWPLLVKALGLPDDAPRPIPGVHQDHDHVWTSPQPGRNWVLVVQRAPDLGNRSLIIIGSREAFKSAEDLANDVPDPAAALEDFHQSFLGHGN